MRTLFSRNHWRTAFSIGGNVVIDIPIALNYSFTSDEALSHESLINILNNLPRVTTRRTLNLMNQNINRLTAEEKQIAADKNWALAN